MILYFLLDVTSFPITTLFIAPRRAQRDIVIAFLSVRPMPRFSVETITHIVRLFSNFPHTTQLRNSNWKGPVNSDGLGKCAIFGLKTLNNIAVFESKRPLVVIVTR